MLVKLYCDAPEGQKWYSPAECVGCCKTRIEGQPDKMHVSTSFVERQNLTMRMYMRRFTRLANAFSKKLATHEHTLGIYFMYYTIGRIHQTLRVTQAMEAGISVHGGALEEIAALSCLMVVWSNDLCNIRSTVDHFMFCCAEWLS